MSALIFLGVYAFGLYAAFEFLDYRHYVKCTNELMDAGVLPQDYWERRHKRDCDDDVCRLKREANERGEHIVP